MADWFEPFYQLLVMPVHPALKIDDPDVPTSQAKMKAEICQIVSMYATKYDEEFVVCQNDFCAQLITSRFFHGLLRLSGACWYLSVLKSPMMRFLHRLECLAHFAAGQCRSQPSCWCCREGPLQGLLFQPRDPPDHLPAG
jgi:hypothetical protein